MLQNFVPRLVLFINQQNCKKNRYVSTLPHSSNQPEQNWFYLPSFLKKQELSLGPFLFLLNLRVLLLIKWFWKNCWMMWLSESFVWSNTLMFSWYITQISSQLPCPVCVDTSHKTGLPSMLWLRFSESCSFLVMFSKLWLLPLPFTRFKFKPHNAFSNNRPEVSKSAEHMLLLEFCLWILYCWNASLLKLFLWLSTVSRCGSWKRLIEVLSRIIAFKKASCLVNFFLGHAGSLRRDLCSSLWFNYGRYSLSLPSSKAIIDVAFLLSILSGIWSLSSEWRYKQSSANEKLLFILLKGVSCTLSLLKFVFKLLLYSKANDLQVFVPFSLL